MQLYAGAKESAALKNSLEVLEGLVKTYAQPLANKAVAAAPHALAAADAKVRRPRVGRGGAGLQLPVGCLGAWGSSAERRCTLGA